MELERLKEEEVVINKRLREWAETARSERPSFVHGGLAGEIVRHCTPLPSDVLHTIRRETVPYIGESPLMPKLTKKELQALREREILVRIARDDTLDILPITDPYFAESFDVLDLIQKNPGVAKAYSEAIPYLRRLFVEREQIALARRQPNAATIDFVFVLNRLLDDL